MKNKLFLNKLGFTLIEVLASLSILTMIIGIIYGVFFTSLKNNEKAKSFIELRQEANLVITTLRQPSNVNQFDLCYKNDKILYLNDAKLTDIPYSFTNVDLKSIDNSGNEQEINNEGECMEVNTTTPLFVTFTLVDGTNNDYKIDTVINWLKPYKPSVIDNDNH